MARKTAIQRICEALGRKPKEQPEQRLPVRPASRSVSYENRPDDAGEPEGVDRKRLFKKGEEDDV